MGLGNQTGFGNLFYAFSIVDFTLGLYIPKGAPKYIRAGYFWLWQLATSSAHPPKAKSEPLGAWMLTMHIKIVVSSTMSEDGPM